MSEILGKGMLYTTVVPILKDGASGNSSDEKELKTHSVVTADEREGLFKLIITFITADGKVGHLNFEIRTH